MILDEVLEQTRRGTGILLRERQHQRPHQTVLHALEVGPLDRAAGEGVLDDAQIHAALAGLDTQVGHLIHGEAAVFSGDRGMSACSHRSNLRDNLLFVFES